MDYVRLEDLLNRHVDGDLTGEDRRELERMLLDSPDARGVFWRFARLNSLVRDNFQSQAGRRVAAESRDEGRGLAGLPTIDGEAGFGVRESGFGIQSSESLSVGAAVEPPQQLDLEPRTPNPEPPFPTLSTTNYPLPTSHFSVGSWAFSYMVATVIMGVAILGFWAYKITHYQHIAEAPSQSVPSDARPEMVFVGRITGMVDVKWSDDPRYLPPPGYAHVPLGRKYILDSGLLEITYDSGAKVILEGPCTYEVESTAGGYLALGKLTARVGEDKETKRQGDKEKKADAPSPHLLVSRSPGLPVSPLFSVRTPTAVITDLGTEFGVEVDEAGTSKTHVFQGRVEVRLSGNKADARAIRLGVGESARVEPGANRIVVVGREAAAPGAFTRRMPKWVPIELFNTGVGLKEGDPDPHWQLVARGDDPDFQPRPAVVTAAHAYWLANDPARSQWLSTANGPPDVPNITYTFSTTFELTDMLPETVVLRGRFIVDNHVQAIRLNGRQLPVSWHGERAFNWFSGEFSAGKHCIEGINTLEIDVLNGATWKSGNKNGPMGLRVELSGSVLSKKKGG